MSEADTHDELICMIGTDHGLAPVELRSQLVLPQEACEEVLALARAKLGATGVVLLSTCNRVELWVSFDGVEAPARDIDANGTPKPGDVLLRTFADMFIADPDKIGPYLVCRAGDKAASHLFSVACGLRSAIVAEDQIVSQVKHAIAFSREVGVAGSVLEVLFRQAITSAKQVKGGVRFTRAHATAIDQAIELLEASGVNLAESQCMVIGNGEYGRLAASALSARKARVIVTVRQYTHGSVAIPRGCTGVPYAERYEHLGGCRIVMSATTSPHFTIERGRLEDALAPGQELALVDLAVPHDIDPSIAEVDGCTLFDIDRFSTDIGDANAQAVAAARRILADGEADFWDWVSRRDARASAKPPVGALFPLFVDFSEKRAVFVGGGTIALRRIRSLLPFVGEIAVYAPDFTPELERFADDGTIALVRRPYTAEILDGADIVFACTNDAAINDEVWAECKRRGVLVNVSSDRFKCDFYFPGVVQSSGVVVGVSAAGKNHRRVRQLRARIERLLEEEDI